MFDSTGSRSVAVAMSGGVDSSVTAALLQQRGYQVHGFTFKLWDPVSDTTTGQPDKITSAIEDARSVCEVLHIPHEVLDLTEPFAREVMAYFDREYLAGKTPNPCVHCNSVIKWRSLWRVAEQRGLDLLATGHYAQIKMDSDGQTHLLRGADPRKEQSYFLWKIPRELLSHTILPLFELRKTEVRELARKFQLPVSERTESQEVCFIPHDDYRAWLLARHPEIGGGSLSGELIDRDGRVLAQHPGHPFFTIGQRKGLGLGGGQKRYVVAIDAASRKIQLGTAEELLTSEFRATQLNCLTDLPLDGSLQFEVKIRYRDPGIAATIYRETADSILIRTLKPVSAATPGQSAVVYYQDEVIAGGIIQ